MTIAFYEHPFSSYVQKAKTALYEKGILFESKMIDGSERLGRRACESGSGG
jgi:glutathione S-transferase